MKHILSVVAVLIAIEVLGEMGVGSCKMSFAQEIHEQATVKAKTIAGDHYFNFGTPLQRVLWSLQRQYPEYTRRVLTDDDGYTDVEEFHRFIFFHYYFKDRKYIGSTTTFHKINKSDEADKKLLNGLVARLKKIAGTEPEVDDANDSFSWSDDKGTQLLIDIFDSPADTFITVRSMTIELVEHPIY